jgi:Sec-independent protein secretion pathway component TatC
MTVSGTDRLARDLESLLDSPQGELINSLSELVRTRIRRWAVLFFVGMAVGYPLAGKALTWIVGQEQLVPNDVSIVILQPLEVVILQLRLAAHLAIAAVALAISVEATLAVSRNAELRDRMGEVNIPALPGIGKALLTVGAGLALAAAGLFYVFHFLLPLLLAYLHADAASVGATSTWQLSAWIGFIAGLSLGAVVGFQVPLITLVALRGGLVKREELTAYRRHLYFSAFILGATLSPPDPLSMFLVAGPMLLLFEVALVLDRLLP